LKTCELLMCGQTLKIKWFIHTVAEKNIVFMVSANANTLYVCCVGSVTCRPVIYLFFLMWNMFHLIWIILASRHWYHHACLWDVSVAGLCLLDWQTCLLLFTHYWPHQGM